MDDLNFASIESLAGKVRAKEISPAELMRHTLDRIDTLNPTFNAFVALDAERAMAEAEVQSARLAKGEDLGPLGGIPLGVKDLENAEGFRTSNGSPVYRDAAPATFDDVHIARLKAAGAIAVGKTNTPEFGHIPFTHNEVFGPSRNPWDPERTPGGSSGGSSAALAAGMVALATATDGGGSIRIPACYTGLYGLKPQFGRVPVAPRRRDQWIDLSHYGPLTRSVRDAALLLDVMAGPHARDRNSLPPAGFSFRDRVEEPPPRLRVAFNRTLGVTRVQPDVMREVEAAVAVFRELGHEVEEDESAIPETAGWFVKVFAYNGLLNEWDNYATRHHDFGSAYVGTLDRALDMDPAAFSEFGAVRQQLTDWTADLFDRYDLLLTPTLPTEAFLAEGPIPLELDGEPFSPIAYTYPFNFTGHPAASIRAGFTDAGLPCGLQIVGPRFREDLVLQVSRAYEEVRPSDRWPDV